ncbi:unnamed protein product [Boreogadus saida]
MGLGQCDWILSKPCQRRHYGDDPLQRSVLCAPLALSNRKHTRCDRKPSRLALGVFASCVDTKGGARGLFHGEPRAPRPPER